MASIEAFGITQEWHFTEMIFRIQLPLYILRKEEVFNDVPCEFKAILELVKRVYRLDPVENTPQKDLRNATSSNVSKAKVRTHSIGVGTKPPRKRALCFTSFDSE